jgi:hypothetical protein
MMEPGAAFSNPSSGKIDQQRKILEVGIFLIIWSNLKKDMFRFLLDCLPRYRSSELE